MEQDHFFFYNRHIEERIDLLLYNVESRLDKLHETAYNYDDEHGKDQKSSRSRLGLSYYSFLTFQKPYLRDIRQMSGPSNQDVRQISQLVGSENIDHIIRNKSWTKETENQLRSVILELYAQKHIVKLIKQKNDLHQQYLSTCGDTKNDLEQKFRLIDEQIEQVRQRKEERIFVPPVRDDPSLDWCAVSAQLSKTQHDAWDCKLMWKNKLHWSINSNSWTRDEDLCLLDATKKYGVNDWDSVAKELNNGKLAWQCCSRYQQEYANANSKLTPLTDDDADKIIEIINLCKIGDYVPWNQVMYFIQYHDLLQVKYQWRKFLAEARSTQPWSHNEDVLLLNLVEKFGTREWNRISDYIEGRSNKSCRERYIMRLKYPKRAIGNWRRREDEILLNLIDRFGTNWTMIAYHFPERNNHQLRNRYELLRNEPGRVGPIKHRKLCKDSHGNLVINTGRKRKPQTEREIDERLRQILSSYQDVKPKAKSLVYRSVQDEIIHQNLVKVVKSSLLSETLDLKTPGFVIKRALEDSMGSMTELMSPNLATLKGFKAWSSQQEYLNQLGNRESDETILMNDEGYHKVLKIAISLFLWPAVLSKIKAPSIDTTSVRPTGIITKDAKNLYKIREIQKSLLDSG